MINATIEKLKQVQSTVLAYKKKGKTITYDNLFTNQEVAELNKFGTLQECVVLVDAMYWGIK